MLLAETRTAHRDAATVEVDSDLPVRTADKGLPIGFLMMRMINKKKKSVGG